MAPYFRWAVRTIRFLLAVFAVLFAIGFISSVNPLMAGVLVVAGSVGVLAGIHLAELSKPRRNGIPARD